MFKRENKTITEVSSGNVEVPFDSDSRLSSGTRFNDLFERVFSVDVLTGDVLPLTVGLFSIDPVIAR